MNKRWFFRPIRIGRWIRIGIAAASAIAALLGGTRHMQPTVTPTVAPVTHSVGPTGSASPHP